MQNLDPKSNTDIQQTRDVNVTTNVTNYGYSNENSTVTADKSEITKAVAQAAIDAAKSSTQTQENDFYTVSQKAYKTAAVASIILPNLEQAKAADMMNQLDFTSNVSANSQYLQSIGASSITPDVSTNFIVEREGKVDLSKLSTEQLDSITSSGSFSANGITYKTQETSKSVVEQYNQAYYSNSIRPQMQTNVAVTAQTSAAANIKTYSANDFQGITAKGQIQLSAFSNDVQKEIMATVPQNNQFFSSTQDVGKTTVSANPTDISYARERSHELSGYFATASNSNSPKAKLEAANSLYDKALGSMSKDQNLKTVYDARINGPKAVNEEIKKVSKTLDSDIKELTDKISNKDINRILEKGQLTNSDIGKVFDHIDKSPLSASEKIKLKECIQSKNALLGFKNTGLQDMGSVLKDNHGLSRMQSNGKRYIANYILGDDMMAGYNKVVQTKRTIEFGCRAAYALTNPIRNTNAALQHTGAKILDKVNPNFNIEEKLISKEHAKLSKKQEKLEKKKANRAGGLTKKDYKLQEKQRRLQKKESKLKSREERYTKRLNNPKSKLSIEERDRLKGKLDRNKSSQTKLFDKRKNITKKQEKLLKKINKKPNVFKRITNKFDHIKTIIVNKIKDIFGISKIIAIFTAIGTFIIHTLVSLMVAGLSLIVIVYCLHFLSNPFAGLEEKLLEAEAKEVKDYLIPRNSSINYEQMIADITCNDLAKSFVEVAELDATKYYLKADKTYTSKEFAKLNKADSDFKSNITDTWYVQPMSGTLGSCWAWEEADNTSTWECGPKANDLLYQSTYVPLKTRQAVAGPSENIVPIFNMMHTRYLGSIEYENWESALAYVYYMYIVSHDVSQYDKNSLGQTINDIHYDDHEAGYAFQYINPHARSELGDASYIENSLLSQKRMNRNESDVCNNLYIHGINTDISPGALDYKTGLTQLFNIDKDVFNKTLKELATNHSDQVGPYTIANDGCWAIESTDEFSNQECGQEASEGSGGLACPNGGVCTNYATTYAGSDFTKCGHKEHEHDSSCYSCDGNGTLNAHTHTSACGKNNKTCTNDLNTHDCSLGGCNQNALSCTIEEHKHTQSCQIKVAYCLGHCGGHLQPVVDIVEKMTYEGLIQDDGFKTPHFVAVEDILGSPTNWIDPVSVLKAVLTDKLKPIDSIIKWKEHWTDKAKDWFSPFPSSFGGFLKTVKRTTFGFLSKIGSPAEDESFEDCNQFDGWWKSTNVPNQEYLDVMEDFYGKFYNPATDPNPEDDRKYDMAKEAWRQFGEFGVEFMTGMGKQLTEEQIQLLMKTFRKLGLSETQLQILEQALREVGLFTYSCTGAGHMNGLKGIGGLSECSGFVGGVLNQVFGTDGKNWGSAATFAHMVGSSPFNEYTCQPGMIVAHANGGNGYTGHVMIYAGWLTVEQGAPDGDGYYTIECTNSNGVNGSQLKKRSLDYLQKCNQVAITGP